MTCACCETGRCCSGATCTETTKAGCAGQSGTHTAGGTCANKTCVARSPYDSRCRLTDPCACAAEGKDVVDIDPPTCNCTTLTAAGVAYGGCEAYACERCYSGVCAYICSSYQDCCAGTCCAESQQCISKRCDNKCTYGTYCNTTTSGGSYSFSCCSSSQKCCGPSGCQAYVSLGSGSAAIQSDKDPSGGGDGWYNTGVDIVSGVSLTITARGRSSDGTFPEGDTQGITCDGIPGGSNRFDTSYNFMAVLGKVGSTVFKVGTSYSGSPGTGRLYLRMNRQNYTFGSSIGGPVDITYSRKADPCPSYTPAAIGEPIVYAAGEEPPKRLPGPGAALKSILRLAGIVSSPTCSCNARAAQMDEWGEWESLKRLPQICGWLKEEAEKRGMWFFRPAGYALVLGAVLLAALKRLLWGNNK